MNIPPSSHTLQCTGIWPFVVEPLKNASIFIICAVAAHVLGSPVVMPLAGLGAMMCLSSLANKISKNYDSPVLRKVITRINIYAQEYRFARMILTISTVAAGHWLPLSAFVISLPVGFLNGIYAVYKS